MAKKAVTRKAITKKHLLVTLERVEAMVGAVRQVLASPAGIRVASRVKRPSPRPLGEDEVALAGIARTGCRWDGSCARIRPLTPKVRPVRPAKKNLKK